MRGKAILKDVEGKEEGITPAHAGKSNLQNLKDLIRRGSPPHMRGKDYYGTKDQWLTRITPAHAGKRLKFH